MVMRDRTILVGLSLAALLVNACLLFYNITRTSSSVTAAGSESAAVASVPVTVLTKGQQANVSKRVNYVLVDKGQLDSLWKSMNASSTEPNVDFQANDVLAIFAGAEPSAGYSVTVSGVEDNAAVRMVHILFQEPGPGCTTSKATVHPFELVSVPKSAQPLQLAHSYATSTVSCK